MDGTRVALEHGTKRKPPAPGSAAGRESVGCGPSGFDLLYAQYERRVFNMIHRLVGNTADACDLTHDVFVKAHRAFPRFRSGSPDPTWLYRIVVDACGDYLKGLPSAQRMRMTSPDPALESAPGVNHPGPGGTLLFVGPMDAGGARDTLQRALSELPADLRVALVLRQFCECTYSEIAAVTGCHEESVRERVFRARRLLAGALRPYVKE